MNAEVNLLVNARLVNFHGVMKYSVGGHLFYRAEISYFSTRQNSFTLLQMRIICITLSFLTLNF